MRVKGGTVTRARRKKMVKLAKGYRGQRRINFKVAKQQVWKSYLYAYRDRKNTKRNFRKLWIARINAAARMNGLSYSKLMHGLTLAGVELNRKMLADIAVTDFDTFAKLAEQAKTALTSDNVLVQERVAATLETTVKVDR
ncbi:50S ribosomal protein L20 [Leuconostoc lactis]|uniref:50S ribosomal protein L20 n=1 Tax=Leuconostoc lactis TaxID=1246 RepID=UPI0037452EBD